MLTWENLVSYISEYHIKENARPNPTLYRLLANARLDEIAGYIGGFDREWTDTTPVDPTTAPTYLVVNGSFVAFPEDCITLDTLQYDGSPLVETTALNLDAVDPDWRTTTGTPTYYVRESHGIRFDRAPGSTGAGLLTAQGKMTLPRFTDPPGATSPLSYLPPTKPLAIANGVLAALPAVSEAELARAAKFEALWNADLPFIVEAVRLRKNRPHGR